MARNERDFSTRETWEQEWMIENTWCDGCKQADLGLTNPVEYELDGKIFVEGKCRVCGLPVVSEICEREIGE